MADRERNSKDEQIADPTGDENVTDMDDEFDDDDDVDDDELDDEETTEEEV